MKRPPRPSEPEKSAQLLFVPGPGDEGTGCSKLGVDVTLGPTLDVLDRFPARDYLVVGLEALAGVEPALVALDGVLGGVRKGVLVRVELWEAMLIVPVLGVCIGPCLLGLEDEINFYPGEFKNLGLLGNVRKRDWYIMVTAEGRRTCSRGSPPTSSVDVLQFTGIPNQSIQVS